MKEVAQSLSKNSFNLAKELRAYEINYLSDAYHNRETRLKNRDENFSYLSSLQLLSSKKISQRSINFLLDFSDKTYAAGFDGKIYDDEKVVWEDLEHNNIRINELAASQNNLFAFYNNGDYLNVLSNQITKTDLSHHKSLLHPAELISFLYQEDSVKIFSLERSALLSSIRLHQHNITAATLHPNQALLTTADSQGYITITDLRCRATVAQFESPSSVSDLAWNFNYLNIVDSIGNFTTQDLRNTSLKRTSFLSSQTSRLFKKNDESFVALSFDRELLFLSQDHEIISRKKYDFLPLGYSTKSSKISDSRGFIHYLSSPIPF